MSASLYETVVVSVNLGEASSFNRGIFPLSYRKRDNLGRGDFYLDATLDEMLKIVNIRANPELQLRELIATTKARYDQLMLQKEELQKRPGTSNPFQMFANYRAARMFFDASKSLYLATKSRSEEMIRSMGRNLLSAQGEDVESVNDDLPPDANIAGIAIRLDGPLDDTTRQQITDATNAMASYTGPFPAQTVSEASSVFTDEYVLASESLTSLVSGATEGTSNPTNLPTASPSTVTQNYYTFYSSVYSPHSIVHGATVQHGGSQNSGSVNHTFTPPN